MGEGIGLGSLDGVVFDSANGGELMGLTIRKMGFFCPK